MASIFSKERWWNEGSDTIIILYLHKVVMVDSIVNKFRSSAQVIIYGTNFLNAEMELRAPVAAKLFPLIGLN